MLSKKGAIEQYVVSTFTSIIPETVRMETKKYYRQNREAVKKFCGHEEEKVAPGWGVEEADQRHREDASTFEPRVDIGREERGREREERGEM